MPNYWTLVAPVKRIQGLAYRGCAGPAGFREFSVGRDQNKHAAQSPNASGDQVFPVTNIASGVQKSTINNLGLLSGAKITYKQS